MFRPLFVYIIVILVCVGCGKEAENSRPVIDTLADQTLSVGETVEIRVGINDANTDEITVHTTSDDSRIATVVVNSIENKSSNNVAVSETRDPAWNVAGALSTSDTGTSIEAIFTITAANTGETLITVNATDNSGEQNAEANPVTFRVIVKESD